MSTALLHQLPRSHKQLYFIVHSMAAAFLCTLHGSDKEHREHTLGIASLLSAVILLNSFTDKPPSDSSSLCRRFFESLLALAELSTTAR
jgi:hypothetical protein